MINGNGNSHLQPQLRMHGTHSSASTNYGVEQSFNPPTSPTDRLAFSTVVVPSVENLQTVSEGYDPAYDVLGAFQQLEDLRPGFSGEFLRSMLTSYTKAPNAVMQESILRRAVSSADESCVLRRSEEAFISLNAKSRTLRLILARIPEEIGDRRVFLETIKEIASAIKRLLDGVHEILQYVPDETARHLIDARKREFVKYSKAFSTTLKDFFKVGNAEEVFRSANALVFQTNLIAMTVKEFCE